MIYSARNSATGAGTVFNQLQFDFIPNQDLIIKRFLSSAYVLPAAPGPNVSWGHLFAFGNNLGGGIEVVVPVNTVKLENFSTVNFDRK